MVVAEPHHAPDSGRRDVSAAEPALPGLAAALSGSFLFAETLRAWVAQLEDGTNEARPLALIRAGEPHRRPLSTTPPTGSNR
jgi:hypothetical protein